MKEVVGILTLLALFHASCATLSIKGPTQPVLRYERVVLDCLVSGPELNLSQVHFEFRKTSLWIQLPDEDNWYMGRCWWPWRALFSHREEGRLFVEGPITEHHGGSYRCVSDAGNASEVLNITVHYMENLIMHGQPGLRGYLGSVVDLKVPVGGSVELECSSRSSVEPEYQWSKEGVDWILPSSKLKLQDMQAWEAGNYTCRAKHPIMDSLIKSRTISITVLPVTASWWESSDGYLILMTSGTILALLLLVITMSAFLCRRAKLAKTTKGPIDDHSQKKPIYKGSAESLPSTCEDNQPLV